MKLPKKGFWPKVDKTESCWLWLGFKTKDGYGRFCTRRNGKITNILAHRYSYEELRGPIPPHTEIDHLCRVRNCINPDHLEAVSHKVNVQRGDFSAQGQAARNRQLAKTHCPQGHPYAGENLYIRPRDGGRVCRSCVRKKSNEHYHKHKVLKTVTT